MKNLREWINEFFLNELVFDRNKMWHLLPFLWRNWSKTRGKCALYRVFIERSRIFPMLRKEFKHAKMGLKLKCYWQIKAFLSQHSVREQALVVVNNEYRPFFLRINVNWGERKERPLILWQLASNLHKASGSFLLCSFSTHCVRVLLCQLRAVRFSCQFNNKSFFKMVDQQKLKAVCCCRWLLSPFAIISATAFVCLILIERSTTNTPCEWDSVSNFEIAAKSGKKWTKKN